MWHAHPQLGRHDPKDGAYAFGYALSQLCWSCAAAATDSELGRLRRVSRLLPDDVPEELLAVAMDVCGDCDLEVQFKLGLDLLLQGQEVA